MKKKEQKNLQECQEVLRFCLLWSLDVSAFLHNAQSESRTAHLTVGAVRTRFTNHCGMTSAQVGAPQTGQQVQQHMMLDATDVVCPQFF